VVQTKIRRKPKQPTEPVVVGEGIVLVDLTFRPIAVDCGAEAILGDVDGHCGGGDGGTSLPLDLLNALKARPLSERAEVLIHMNAGGRSYSCRFSTVNPRTGGLAEPVLALYLKRELSMVEAVHEVGMEYSLTGREQEALIGVAMGLTSKELATQMKISPNTVKAFLRLIMVKMGATTRAGIVGRLLDSERAAGAGGSRRAIGAGASRGH
jgi:DNA-binding CsgD family transcriptional regulator